MHDNILQLLDRLIATPSTSRDEADTAAVIEQWLSDEGVKCERVFNNVWALARDYDPSLPTLMLNSHHDTVRPAPSYSFDPYQPIHRDGRIFGLGSNDAGASLVSLIEVFCRLRNESLPFNLLLAASAEEEVSGECGMRALLPVIQTRGIRIDAAIVGEPTGMQPAVAERGLVVLDCVAHGVSGHAARNEGVNALYKALDDISRLRGYKFDRVSETLGDIKMTVTQIEAGRQHNVVPDECRFVVDVRTTDAYTNERTVEIIADLLESDVKARSCRIRASVIAPEHPLVAAVVAKGKVPFVSPTTSDMALMPDFPTLKMGPGESSRSHTADEYIYEHEIFDAIEQYQSLLESLKL